MVFNRRNQGPTDNFSKWSPEDVINNGGDENSFSHQRRNSVTKKIFHRRSSSMDETAVTLSSCSGSHTSYSSSAGTNIWTKLLGGNNEALWDGINGKDAFDDNDDKFMDNTDQYYYDNSCSTSTKRCGLSWWYEVKHFTRTLKKYPYIWISSLLVFGMICGVGMVAINAKRDNYIEKQKDTAEFVVSLYIVFAGGRGESRREIFHLVSYWGDLFDVCKMYLILYLHT